LLSWLPENASSYAAQIDSIFYLIYYIIVAWFFLVLGILLYFLVRYRRREGRRAAYVPGNTWKQVAWILIPAAVVLVMDLWIDFRGAKVWEAVKGGNVQGEMQVRLAAKQFNWDFIYPGPDKAFETADDLKIENELHVPVGKVVQVFLNSEDVIHSFFVPTFRLKQDVLPGREIPVWFKATKPGKYELPCAELCGFGHSGMKGWVIVHSAEDFEEWRKKKWSSARKDPSPGELRPGPVVSSKESQSAGIGRPSLIRIEPLAQKEVKQ
jgi:cytochrome c oxidase subunit 2